ncbi:MAG TPA: ATP-binding protein, partial [Rhizobiales bacterium]|nr:ATP-binding protein [Hyphomicrobiales bacterium]
FEQVARNLATDEKLAEQARANTLDQFRYAFDERAINELIKSNERNSTTSSKIFSDDKLRGLWLDLMRLDFFRRANMVQAHAVKPDDLVEAGESSQVEFKSSARWDQKQNQANPVLEYVIVKTVAGYMNGEGGTLLIGVDDDGKVLGLKPDLKLMKGKDRDGYELWLTDIIGRSLGKPNVAHARISFPETSGEMICRIDVNPAPEAVFATPLKGEKKSEFWVRMNNSTRQLDMKEMHEYQRARFGPG